ncbi:uncharacterized protein B0H18DRAFT_651967 [Fomitopsis serialis]|uniref:uncharacterized protein n=1 Tax=Fomitopsis serialis TaxID=139415 RepID=UPI0020075ECC|nr:uncharacterized protein B0H18DRAFT_651967 [Neoantrodia serialis]KAH9919246.1 hypothetical protein B0H18DRAFT_651967 [Neoantrodia serialis]
MRVCGGGGVTADEDGISHILVTSSSAPRQSSLARHLHAEPPTASHAYPPSGRSCTTVPLKVIRVTVPCSCSPPTYTQRPPRRDSRKAPCLKYRCCILDPIFRFWPLSCSTPAYPLLSTSSLLIRLVGQRESFRLLRILRASLPYMYPKIAITSTVTTPGGTSLRNIRVLRCSRRKSIIRSSDSVLHLRSLDYLHVARRAGHRLLYVTIPSVGERRQTANTNTKRGSYTLLRTPHIPNLYATQRSREVVSAQRVSTRTSRLARISCGSCFPFALSYPTHSQASDRYTSPMEGTRVPSTGHVRRSLGIRHSRRTSTPWAAIPRLLSHGIELHPRHRMCI